MGALHIKYLILFIFLLYCGASTPVFAVCNHSSSSTCSKLIRQFKKANNPKGLDRASQAASFCHQLKANDEACKAQIPLAAAYTLAAVTCTAVCAFELGIIAATGGAAAKIALAADYVCLISSIAAAAGDIGVGLYVSSGDYAKKASSIIAEDWGIGLPVASAVVNGGLLAFTRAKTSAATAQAMAAEEAAMLEAAQCAACQVEMTEGAYVSFKPRAGGPTVNPGQEAKTNLAAAEKQFARANEAAQKAQQNASQTKKNMKKLLACVSAGLNVTMAGIKWYDYNAIIENSEKNKSRLTQLTGFNPSLTRRENDGFLSPFSSDSSPPNSPGTGMGGFNTLADAAEKAFATGEAPTALNADASFRKTFGDPGTDNIRKAFDDFTKTTGIKPGALAEAAQQNGVANTVNTVLGQLGGNSSKELQDYLTDVESKAREWWMQNNAVKLAFTDSNSSTGASGRPDALSGFGGLGKLLGRKPSSTKDGKIQPVEFSGFDGDIWHAGSTKTIFEIVSDRTQAVADRVMK